MTTQERTRLQEELRRLSFVREVRESDANFFLVQVCDKNGVHIAARCGRRIVARVYDSHLIVGERASAAEQCYNTWRGAVASDDAGARCLACGGRRVSRPNGAHGLMQRVSRARGILS